MIGYCCKCFEDKKNKVSETDDDDNDDDVVTISDDDDSVQQQQQHQQQHDDDDEQQMEILPLLSSNMNNKRNNKMTYNDLTNELQFLHKQITNESNTIRVVLIKESNSKDNNNNNNDNDDDITNHTTKEYLNRTTKFCDAINNMIEMITTTDNKKLNENLQGISNFIPKLPEISTILLPISSILTMIKTCVEVRIAIIGLWERLFILLDQLIELIEYVTIKKQNNIQIEVDNTVTKYLNLMKECITKMVEICNDRKKHTTIFKHIWTAQDHIEQINILQNKIDENLKHWTILNGFKILVLSNTIDERLRTMDNKIDQLLLINNNNNNNIGRQRQQNNMSLEKLLDSFCMEDERLIQDNTTMKDKKFMNGTRQWIFHQFKSWVNNNNNNNNKTISSDNNNNTKNKNQILILAAPAGFGKSQIVYQIVNKYRHDTVIAWHFVRYDNSMRRNPKRMLLSLSYQLAMKLSDYKLKLEESISHLTKSELLSPDYNIKAIFERLIETPLSQITINNNNNNNNRPYVIVLDALDECDIKDGKNELLDCIVRYFHKLPSWLKIFITTRPEYPMMDKLSLFNPIEITPSNHDNNQKDLQFFFRQSLKHTTWSTTTTTTTTGRNNNNNKLDVEKAIRILVEKSGGLFMVAQFLVDTIKNETNLTIESIEALPTGNEGFYSHRFHESIFPCYDSNNNSLISSSSWSTSITWKVLQLIVVAKQPVNLCFIRSLLKCETQDLRKAIEKLSLFLNLTNPYKCTSKKSIIDETKVSACHKSFTDWLTDTNRKYEDYYIDIQKANELIANHCLEYFNVEKIANTDDVTKYIELPKHLNYQCITTKYFIRHGISHLYDAKMYKEARQILLNVGWMIVAARIKGPHAIVYDYRLLAKDDIVMYLIVRAVVLSSNAIQKNWKQLPSQIIGRLCASIDKRSNNHNDQVRIQLINLINRLKEYSYGYSWWCPVGSTWDQAEDPCLKVLKGGKNYFKFVSFSPNGSLVVYCDSERVDDDDNFNNSNKLFISPIVVWEIDDEKIIYNSKINGLIKAGIWTNDGLYIASYCPRSMTLMIWFVTKDCHRMVNQLHLGNKKTYGFKVVFSSNQKMVAIVGEDIDTIMVWDITSENQQQQVVEFVDLHNNKQNTWYSVAWSPDSTRLVTSSSCGNKVAFWKVSTNIELKLEFQYDVNILHNNDESSYMSVPIDWSPNVEYPRVALGLGSNIYIIDAKNNTNDGQVICTLPIVANRIHHAFDLLWSPDGTRLAVAFDKKYQIDIWDINKQRCDHKLKGHTYFIKSFKWLADGTQLVSTSVDKSIRIWSTTNTKVRNSIPNHCILEKTVLKNSSSIDNNNDTTSQINCKDLISEQRYCVLKTYRTDDGKEFLWLQYNGKILFASLQHGNLGVISVLMNFWNPENGKHLGQHQLDKSNFDILDFEWSDIKTIVQSPFYLIANANTTTFLPEIIITDNDDIVPVDEFTKYWSVCGRLAVGWKFGDFFISRDLHPYFFELRLKQE